MHTTIPGSVAFMLFRCLPHPPLLFFRLLPLCTFYCETGVDSLSSWNFNEYWSDGNSGLWGEEQGWKRSDGRTDGWVKVAEGVVKKEEEGDEAEDREAGGKAEPEGFMLRWFQGQQGGRICWDETGSSLSVIPSAEDGFRLSLLAGHNRRNIIDTVLLWDTFICRGCLVLHWSQLVKTSPRHYNLSAACVPTVFYVPGCWCFAGITNAFRSWWVISYNQQQLLLSCVGNLIFLSQIAHKRSHTIQF